MRLLLVAKIDSDRRGELTTELLDRWVTIVRLLLQRPAKNALDRRSGRGRQLGELSRRRRADCLQPALSLENLPEVWLAGEELVEQRGQGVLLTGGRGGGGERALVRQRRRRVLRSEERRDATPGESPAVLRGDLAEAEVDHVHTLLLGREE